MSAASARVIADSITADGHRLITFEASCWRPVLAEQNTHCVLARNSASSRAIPVGKMLKRFDEERDANPIVWPSEIKGMQGGPPLEGDDRADAQSLWNSVQDFIYDQVSEYVRTHPIDEEGQFRLHKSILNRLLENGLFQTQIITATQWDGYFWQRCHKDAEPHIRAMAEAMRDACEASTPRLLLPGEWHLPYWAENGGHESDWEDAAVLSTQFWHPGFSAPVDVAKCCSAARCARVSYLTQSGVRDISEDLDLWSKLTTNRVGSEDPPHASPLEHVCTPWAENVQYVDVPGTDITMGPLPRLGKMVGWLQLRHQVLGF